MAAATDTQVAKRLRFRTYVPRDEELKKCYEKQMDPEEIVQEIIEKQEKLIKECNEKLGTSSKDLSKLAPKKPNWDLKRDVTPKLEKLERRTQRAILELVRERAGQGETKQQDSKDVEGDGTDLVNAVDQVGEGEEDSDLD